MLAKNSIPETEYPFHEAGSVSRTKAPPGAFLIGESMACYYPMLFYRDPAGKSPNGKWPIVSTEPKSGGIRVTVPCGRCIGCRLERSRQWAVRIMNEASMHEKNAFITLTYNDDNIIYGKNESGTLVKTDLQKFWKRLRKAYHGNTIRYFACGEYGSTTNRPHYHAALLGFDFADKRPWSVNQAGDRLYISDSLNDIWGLGNCIIGDLTFESAAYVARYIMGKKLGNEREYYNENGIEPEYTNMSRRPGIGYDWFQKYKNDVINLDIQVVNGKETKPPKYYDKLLERENKEKYDENKSKRMTHRFASRKEATSSVKKILKYRKREKEVEKIKEHIKLQKLNRLKRTL